MKTNSTFSLDESAQEIALRATLHEHAPVDVNVDRAWFIVSRRLSTNVQSSTCSTLCTPLSWFPGKGNRIAPLKGRLIVGAVALVAILVAGINLLFPLMPGTSSVADAKQFQPIGISQSLNGITITADKGYASSVGIVILYHVQPSALLAKNLTAALMNTSTVKDQKGQPVQLLLTSSAASTGCGGSGGFSLPLSCYDALAVSHPLTGSNKIEIIWNVTGAELVYHTFSANHTPTRTSKFVKGLWSFHITLTLHSGDYIPDYEK